MYLQFPWDFRFHFHLCYVKIILKFVLKITNEDTNWEDDKDISVLVFSYPILYNIKIYIVKIYFI